MKVLQKLTSHFRVFPCSFAVVCFYGKIGRAAVRALTLNALTHCLRRVCICRACREALPPVQRSLVCAWISRFCRRFPVFLAC